MNQLQVKQKSINYQQIPRANQVKLLAGQLDQIKPNAIDQYYRELFVLDDPEVDE